MILVTGGTGFIGQAVLETLSARGHTLRVLCRKAPDFPWPKNITYNECNLLELESNSEVFHNVTSLIHLASTTIPSTSMNNMVYDIKSNVEISLRLLEGCVANNIKTFIFSSSGGTVYGQPTSLPVTEISATNPISSYGVVKLAIEKYLDIFSKLHGIRTVALRISNPYGPAQFKGMPVGAIANFLNRIHASKPITIFGDGSVIRDYIYIDDVVRAIEISIADVEDEGIQGVFNISSGDGFSLNQILSVITEVTNITPNVTYEASRQFDVSKIYLSNKKFEKLTSWTPQVSLTGGTMKMWDYLKS